MVVEENRADARLSPPHVRPSRDIELLHQFQLRREGVRTPSTDR